MRRAWTALGAAVVAGALGAGGGSAGAQNPIPDLTPSPTPTPTPEPTATPAPTPPPVVAGVTLRASRAVVVFDGRRSDRVRLTGALSSSAPVARVRVRLVGRSPAYRRDAVLRTARTSRSGRFRFRVRPQVNARYRVVIAPGQGLRGRSPKRTVRVFPRLGLTSAGRDGGLRLRMSATAPARLRFDDGDEAVRVRPGGATRAFFYVRLRGETIYRRVGAGRLSDVRCAATCVRSAALVVRRRSLIRRTVNAGACVRGTAFRGLGERISCGAARRRF